MYTKKLSGPFLTLVRGSRLTEERTASAQTWYVGITCVWPLLESKSGRNHICHGSIQGLLSGPFLALVRGSPLADERTRSASSNLQEHMDLYSPCDK